MRFLLLFVISPIFLFCQLEPFFKDSALKDKLISLDQKFGDLRIGGYIQTQFQLADTAGAESWVGGNFPATVSNRFMIRRGRVRFDYFKKKEGFKQFHFAFQTDATERGVVTRDLFIRMYEPLFNCLVLTSGMFNRPMGYETQLSSARRESPERGRMNQILMRNERDLGAMLSFEPQQKNHQLRWLGLHLGVFNGPGLTSTLSDYDSYKDLIARIEFKDINLLKFPLTFHGGFSYLNGGIGSDNQLAYRTVTIDNKTITTKDSSPNNLNTRFPKTYYNLNIRVIYKLNKNWELESRAEYIFGTQSALENNSNTPTELPQSPVYIRNFSGMYFYGLVTYAERHQFVVKFDSYDPNTNVSGKDISLSTGFSAADIRYNTWGVGYIHYFNPNLKIMLYLDMPSNETTLLPDYNRDLPDNVWTIRGQILF